ncbi:hypothetical protein AGMMS49574_29180 [Bacteroidia bacterium]|nr:hypothetical protein AGMMS49574_29180 [Bacteroidia bacterium]
MANASDIKYGRYYLTILISCVNSLDFSQIVYNDDVFICEKNVDVLDIFNLILNLRKTHKHIYNHAIGIEYLYFSLINKFYNEKSNTDITTKMFLKEILLNKKHMEKYLNQIAKLPDALINSNSRRLLIKDLVNLTADDIEKNNLSNSSKKSNNEGKQKQ